MQILNDCLNYEQPDQKQDHIHQSRIITLCNIVINRLLDQHWPEWPCNTQCNGEKHQKVKHTDVGFSKDKQSL